VDFDWFTVTLKDVTINQSWTVIAPTCHTTSFQRVSALMTIGHRYQVTFLNHDDDFADDASWSFVDQVTVS
jgi:serine protease